MCGIAGALRFTPDHGAPEPGARDVAAITRALAHRGPHGDGFWDGPGVTLGHRRLAIVDLTDRGAQPMTRGALTTVYNGELYNFRQLRRELSGRFEFTSDTDTEVVLRAWQQWGPAAVDRFDGMYAFAVHDARTGQLHLVRDRLGIKPLYLYQGQRFLLFASEVQALLVSPLVTRRPDLHAWYRQLLCSSTLLVDRRATLLEGIRSVPAATRLSITSSGAASIHRYWDLPAGDPDPPTADLGELLTATVEAMRMGDVPVAAFLSGGLDSSAITAAAASAGPITAVTVVHAAPPGRPPGAGGACGAGGDGGAGAGAEDLRYSRILAAAHPAVVHHVSVQPTAVTLADLDAVCDLAAVTEDPRHLGILGNYRAVAELGLRVVLNGQGADETMAGYVGQSAFIRDVLDVAAPSAARIRRLPAARQATALSGDVLAARAAAHAEVLDFHRQLPGPPLEAAHRLLTALQLGRVVQFEDHLAMSAGVEARFPYLAHQLVEWAFTGPFDRHLEPGTRTGKARLRAAAAAILPLAVLTRPKQPFPHPDPVGLQHTLAALAHQHAAAVLGDPLLQHLFRLPSAGRLTQLPAPALWLLLSTWRWHHRISTASPAPGPAPGPAATRTRKGPP